MKTKKRSKKIKRVNKNELKKVKGGKDILGPISKGLGIELGDGVKPAIDVGKKGVSVGIKFDL